MSDFTQIVQDCTDGMSRLRADFESQCRDIFVTMFAAFFAQYPAVKTIYWSQYVPSFNDGEPCEFSIGEIQFSPAEAAQINGPYFGEETEDAALKDFTSYPADPRATPDLLTAMRGVSKLLNEIAEHVERSFGRNAWVRITRDATLVEDFDCGH